MPLRRARRAQRIGANKGCSNAECRSIGSWPEKMKSGTIAIKVADSVPVGLLGYERVLRMRERLTPPCVCDAKNVRPT
jgi:hypothetical protein